jgi:predicted permease
MNLLLLDVRTALRFFARRRVAFTAMVLAMSLVVGANTVVFSVLRAFFAGSLGIHDDQRVMAIWTVKDLPGQGGVKFSDAFPNFQLLRKSGLQTLSNIAAAHPANFNWELPNETRRVSGAMVSAALFDVMRVRPAIGRVFAASDEGPHAAPVAVVSHRFWKTALGGAPDAIGRTLRLDNQPIVVIGVLPEHFSQPVGADIWRPFDLPEGMWTAIVTGRQLQLYGRLADGATLGALNTELRAFASRATELSADNKDWRWIAEPLREALLDQAGNIALFVQAGAAVLLVLALANLVALLLAWAAERERETAVRLALGATRPQLFQQFLVQSLLLTGVGGVGGVLLAASGLPLVQQLVPGDVLSELLAGARIDATALAFALVTMTLVGVLAGLLPVTQVRRTGLDSVLRSETRGAGASRTSLRWQRAMVVVQSAVTVLILTEATLAGLGFHRLSRAHLGFVAEGRAVFRVQFPDATFSTHQQRARFVREFEQALAQRPEIAAFGLTSTLPVGDPQWGSSFFLEKPEGGFTPEAMVMSIRRITPSYLAAMGIPLLEGRGFTEFDREDTTQVAIISKTMAKRYWPGQSALGKRLRRMSPANAPLVEIVGVAGDVHDDGAGQPPGETVYTPFEQVSARFFSAVLVGRGSPQQALTAGRSALRSLSSEIAPYEPATLPELVVAANALPRLQLILLGNFASIAVVLAGLGCYGVMEQLAANRRREMAIRVALGATPGGVRRLILRTNAQLAFGGALLGAMLAWGAARAAEGRLPGFSAEAPWVYFAVLAGVLLLTQAASFLPAQRLARQEVQKALMDA